MDGYELYLETTLHKMNMLMNDEKASRHERRKTHWQHMATKRALAAYRKFKEAKV